MKIIFIGDIVGKSGREALLIGLNDLNAKELHAEQLSSEIISLKNKIYLLESKLDEKNKKEFLIEDEIDEINKQIEHLNNSMLTLYDE